MVELSEEEHIALSLKVSMDSIWEEQATWVVSFIYDQTVSTLTRFILFILYSNFFFSSGIVVLMFIHP